jgi:hypothetical protein
MLISYPTFIQLHIISCIYHILAIKRALKVSFIMRQTINVGHLLVRVLWLYASLYFHDHMSYCIEFDIMNQMS